MPLISTLGTIGAQSFGNRGLRYGGSAFFNAFSDYLIVPFNATAFTHTGNYTIEMWLNPTSISGIQLLWRQGGRVFLYITGGQVVWWTGSNPYPVSAIAVTPNQWNHVAVVRNAGIVTIYVNGVGSGSVFNFDTVTIDRNPLIGSYDGANYQYFGYLTNLRVAQQALYTANFTPSGIPLTVNSQGSTTTQLLLNMRTASTLITDSSANNFALVNAGVTYADLTPFLQPYVTPPVTVIQSAVVTPTTFTSSEGTTITFNVVGTNTPNGTYYYTIEEDISTGAVTGSDFTSGALSGTFSISGNNGSFPLTVSRDLVTEGSEEFIVYVRSGSTSGAILGTSGNITISDTSLTPSFTVAPTTFEEPESTTFSVENIGPDGTYFWTILNGTTTNADFSAASGSFIVSGSTGGVDNGVGSFGVTVLQDRVTEGSQTFQVQVRSGSTSGTVILTSPTVTITDTSLTPAFVTAPVNINEGSTTTYTVNNLGPAGTYYWTIQNLSTTNDDFFFTNGSFTTSTLNGNGSFSIDVIRDYATEGTQTFQLQIREGSTSGTVILTSASITVNDTSTTVTASGSPTSFNEGASTTITASATAFPNGTYFWTILNGTTTNADFVATSGSFTVSNGVSGTFTVTAATLDGAEGTEFFQVQIRTGSTSGPVIATTGSLTINLSAT